MPGGVILGVVAIFGIFFLFMVLAFVYAGRYKKVGPNEVLIISGRGVLVQDPATGQKVRRSFHIVRGGASLFGPSSSASTTCRSSS